MKKASTHKNHGIETATLKNEFFNFTYPDEYYLDTIHHVQNSIFKRLSINIY